MARGKWLSRSTFLLAAIGSAVGLGNVWRFPYMTYEYGGGAFLIPYLIALLVVGIPLLMVEFAIGQKFQAGAAKSLRSLHKRFGGVGIFALISSFVIVTYYAVVMAWSLLYFLASFSVPWAGQSQEYFFGSILQLSDSVNILGGMNWPVVAALLAVWVMIYFCVWKGVKSVGKIVWWTVPLPILLLLVLLIRGVTLPGFIEGWIFYLQPDWSALIDPEVWIAAIGQIFFTLTLGFGVMIAYASYNKKDQNVKADTFITALTNSAISLFAGFVVFAILGHMASQTGASVADVAAAGPGLAFVVFPEALSLLPLPWLFSALFFITLLTLGIDSAFSLVEAVNAAIKDTKWGAKKRLEKISLWVCGVGFVGGLIYATNAGLYFLDIVDHWVNFYNILLVGLMQAILVGWVYKQNDIRDFISERAGKPLGAWWNICIKFIIPILLTVLMVNQLWTDITVPYEGYPGWALGVGWAVLIVPLIYLLVSLIRKPQSE